MSLPECFPSEIPAMICAIVEPLMKPNEMCRWLGQHVHEWLDKEGFAALHAELGRAGLNPIMLSIVPYGGIRV
ncbi:MAG: hypothetical protein ACOYL5_08575 [Phototrophicaceae bacterium]